MNSQEDLEKMKNLSEEMSNIKSSEEFQSFIKNQNTIPKGILFEAMKKAKVYERGYLTIENIENEINK